MLRYPDLTRGFSLEMEFRLIPKITPLVQEFKAHWPLFRCSVDFSLLGASAPQFGGRVIIGGGLKSAAS